MIDDEKTKINWLYLIGLIWGGISPICLCLGLSFIAFYDSPIDPNAGMGMQDYTMIWSVISFPILCFISSIGIRFLKDRNKRLASYFALLPIIPLIPIFAIFGWSSLTRTEEQGNSIQISECNAILLYKVDELNTTGCGSLQFGTWGSGTLSTTSEAQNWQFSAESGQTKVTVKNDGSSCPQVVILDANGALVDGFDDENSLRLCPSGMITTGFFEFHPPSPGTYIVRLFSPETPGTYWLKIE